MLTRPTITKQSIQTEPDPNNKKERTYPNTCTSNKADCKHQTRDNLFHKIILVYREFCSEEFSFSRTDGSTVIHFRLPEGKRTLKTLHLRFLRTT